MPKTAARSRRSIATVTSTAVIGASVAVLLLPVTAPPAGAAAAPGSTQRASLASPNNTASARGGQDSALSGNGESVAFTSTSRLDPSLDVGSGESQPYQNVFVRDLRNPQRTVMISRGQFTPAPPGSGTGGGDGGVNFGSKKLLALQPGAVPKDTPPNGSSFNPSISADGRFVAFETFATNIVDLGNQQWADAIVIVDRDPDGDGNYDEDRQDNGTRDYKYYLVTTNGSLPKIAANASRIVYEVSNDGTFLRARPLNLPAGTLGEPEQVPSDIGTGINDDPIMRSQSDPAISGDGNHIVWEGRYQPSCDCSDFNALVSSDMRTKEATRVDFDPAPGAGPNQPGKTISTDELEKVHHPAVNVDGTVIAFVADQFEWHSEQPQSSLFNEPTTYVVRVDYSRANGKRVFDSQIVSRDNNFTIINGDRPALSNDGRYIAFVTNNLNAHDGNDGAQTNGDCIKPSTSTVIKSQRDPLLRLNALPPQRNAAHTTCQVVMRDLIVDRDRLVNEQPRLKGTLVSPNQAGNAGNGNTVPDIKSTGREDQHDSSAPSLSSDGGRVAYDSDATDLVAQPADNNRATDVFVRTLEPTVRGAAINFGDVQIGTTATRTVRLDEVGFGPVTVEQLSFIGANAANFSLGGQTCTGQTIHTPGFCEVSVRFSPTVEGARNAQLLVQMRGARRATVNLTGNGTPVPLTPAQFAAQPNPLNFGGRLLLSEGSASAVTVTNGGQSPLTITAVDIVGPGNPEDFRISTNTCGAPVPGGGQCAVSIAFSPKGSGNRSAVLRFTDNVLGGPHLVGLQGSANQPSITVSPGITPPGRVVTVTGKDFPPGHDVTVKFQDRPGQSKIRTKDDGTFQTPLLIFPKASPETRTVQATIAEITDPLGSTTLLIVFATVSPANFVIRG